MILHHKLKILVFTSLSELFVSRLSFYW